MERTRNHPARGITAIELLIIISVLGIVIVFAAPVVSSAFWTSEVDQAVRATEKSVSDARTLARLYKTNVIVHIDAGEERPASITVSIPSRHRDVDIGDLREQVTLSDDVEVLGGDVRVEFNPDGEVDLPAMVMLTSRLDRSTTHKLVID
ncbi:MAG: hypothetical protein P8Y52_11235 [Xanthomonadales bacterium]